MDVTQMKKKVLSALTKHKYALAILALGLLFVLLPTATDTEKTQTVQSTSAAAQEKDPQQELQDILSRIDGAGKVEVLLTYASGAVTVYQEDTDITEGDTTTSRYQTVVIRGSDGSETGLIQQIIPAKYLGAVILCQGADKPKVKLAIVEAVSRATGLGADQISVLKMK